MKWKEILRKDKYALLQSESDTQYAVVSGYDPTLPENEQWSHGTYFTYWNDSQKANSLANALDLFRSRTEYNYISRCRLEELATKFKDGLYGAYLEEEEYEEFFDYKCGMDEYEKEFFGMLVEEEE